MAPSRPPRKFTDDVRKKYLDSVRSGNMKFESARLSGVSMKTIERRRRNDPEFREDEARAFDEANEGVEKVLRDMAMLGDISAIKIWTTSHMRATYGQKSTIEIDATDKAVEMSKANALGSIANLQATLEKRRLELESENAPTDFIDLPSEEV
jgi:hypothetical protein